MKILLFNPPTPDNKRFIQKDLCTQFLPLLLIILFALFLRLYFFVGLGFNDDSYYLEYAEKIYKGLEFKPPQYVWAIRIGVYLPVVLSWKVFGISEWSTSLLFLILSMSGIIITYLLGKELFNDKIGLIASSLLAVFPLDVIYSTQIGPDLPFQIVFAWSVFYFIRAYKTKRKHIASSLTSGLCLGCSYLFKETIFLPLICLLFYPVWDGITSIFNANKFITTIQVKKLIIISFFVLSGFLIVYSAKTIYLHHLTGDWFFGEKASNWTLMNDGNKNDDFRYYPRALFNMDQDRFGWIHSKPLLGNIYYFVLVAIIVLILKRTFNSSSLFVVFWLLLIFLFFQYGLHFIATTVVQNGMRPRHLRFLLPMSIPAALIIAQACYWKNNAMRFIVVCTLLCFSFNSIYYIYISQKFLRNGMGYVREAVFFLQKLQDKKIYIPDFWTLSKFKFFAGYDDKFVDRLVVYECDAIRCENKLYSNGDYIKDAYVVTYVSPYTFINTRNKNQKIYPSFMISPPAKWKRLTTIHLENYGIFGKFEPKIFYVPGI
jgi:4-amino-4-deoxy-L-arabinose transferase-like glycosyltransferase